MPALLPRVKLYTKDYPIFEEYGVRNEIDKALRSKVWLKSGGYIVINQTEALVAIDVNTGRYVGKKTGRLEDTIVKTNLEAAKEIVRQLRLRDLGGIIVLDFIDMEERKNRQKVFQALEQELKKDRSPSKAIQVSEFGLVDRHAQAREAEPRAPADRPVPLLLRHRDGEVHRDHLLRHPVRAAQGEHRAERARRAAAREPGDCPVVAGGGTGSAARPRARRRPEDRHQARRARCITSSSTSWRCEGCGLHTVPLPAPARRRRQGDVMRERAGLQAQRHCCAWRRRPALGDVAPGFSPAPAEATPRRRGESGSDSRRG